MLRRIFLNVCQWALAQLEIFYYKKKLFSTYIYICVYLFLITVTPLTKTNANFLQNF